MMHYTLRFHRVVTSNSFALRRTLSTAATTSQPRPIPPNVQTVVDHIEKMTLLEVADLANALKVKTKIQSSKFEPPKKKIQK